MPNRHLDLDLHKAEFVTGVYASVRQVAKAHGIAPSTLARHARIAKDAQGFNWYENRQMYLQRTQGKALEILSDQDAVALAARQSRILKVADSVLDLFEQQKPAIEAQIAAGKMPISVRDMVVVAELMRTIMGAGKKEDPKPGGGLSLLQVFGGNGGPQQGVVPSDLVSRLESELRSRVADAPAGAGDAGRDSEAASPD